MPWKQWPCLLGLMLCLLACGPALRQPLFIGIEPVRGDSIPGTLSARLLANLAAMPNVRVVDLSAPRNAWDFDNLSVTKIRLSTALDTGEFCLRSSYVVFVSGQLQYESGLAIPWAEASSEGGCIDLHASRLYGDLIRQGL